MSGYLSPLTMQPGISVFRLESAKKRLETTTDNIDDITRQIGYEDSSTFRRLFKKYTALSQREYRDKFSICRKYL